MRYDLLLFSFILMAPTFAAEMVLIPAGQFLMGCTQQTRGCERNEGKPGGKKVYVSAFYIDPYEVSVMEYRACVKAGQCQAPKTHAINQYCNYDAPGREQYPVNCVDWPDAANFCSRNGKRLPLEAEWEKAARAGTETSYIWGAAPSCKQAILNDGRTKGSVVGELDGCGEDRTGPIGSRPPNGFGLYDMLGNVSEWVQNWYHPDALKMYAAGNLNAPPNGQLKVIRGGAWDEVQVALRSASRYAKTPRSGVTGWSSNGFRCAKNGA